MSVATESPDISTQPESQSNVDESLAQMQALIGQKKKKKGKTSSKLANAREELKKLAGDDFISDLQTFKEAISKRPLDTSQNTDNTELDQEKDEIVSNYEYLLDRAYNQIYKNEKDASKDRRHLIPVPVVQRDGGKKSAFTNFMETCRSLNREKDKDHMLAFLYAELQTQGAIDQNQNLILKGKWNSAKLEQVLRKYIDQYVMCPQCKDIDTGLVRDPASRLYTLHCNTCRASRSVAPIAAGYRAQVGRRRR